MEKFNDFHTNLMAAELYFHLGYGIIPLLGDLDPTRPKVAARPWAPYQHRRASLAEITEWFSPKGGAAALGIVTGRISSLVVLDFDSADLFADFRSRFPHLTETRTVLSAGRGLPHLYFHLPAFLQISSHKRQGVDLLSDGRYVVAPPTSINGQAYRITRGGMPRSLTEHDINCLRSFLTDQKSNFSTATLNPSTPLSMQSRGVGGEDASLPSPVPSVGEGLRPSRSAGKETSHEPKRITTADLHTLYRYWCSKGGRNDALFRTAIYARDHGWDETQTRRSLTTLHVSTHSPSGAKSPLSTQWRGVGGEDVSIPSIACGGGLGRGSSSDPALRQREAYATIRSVFSRPARIKTKILGEGLRPSRSTPTLPNSVRESLFQQKRTDVVRTLEGLFQSGYRQKQGFSADQAINTLKGIVGRDSVYNALNAQINGQPIFPQPPPSALPPASKEAANQTQALKTKKCFFVTGQKSGIKRRGVKQRRFKMPTIKQLCNLLGVKDEGGDVITRDDLVSARQTRMALHRQLIKRRPAEYSRRWLANRLGVSRRTLDAYNHLIPIQSRPTYHTTPLSWANIDSVLSDEILDGAFIETILGKRYPALHAIAAKLLKKGTYLRLQQRASNFYWYEEPVPAAETQASIQQINAHPEPQSFSADALKEAHLSNLRDIFRVGAELIPPAMPSPQTNRQRRSKVFVERDYASRPYPQPNPEPPKPAEQPPEPANTPKIPLPPVGDSLRPSHSLAPLSMQWRGIGGKDHTTTANPPLSVKRKGVEHKNASPAQQEALAQTLYTHINGLSLKNARKLVRTYSEKNINLALQRLQQRTNLTNPTGFFVTVLRSTARMEHNH